MKDKEILQKIIDSDGSCNWSNPEICAKCPMSRLKFREDGNSLSCVDALNIENVKIEDRDKIYKVAAEKVLADIEIDGIIGDE
jgi:hypothetical protein